MKGSLVLAFVLIGGLVLGTPRDGYRAVFGVLTDGRVAWRAWTEGGEGRLLAVDPVTLTVSVVPGSPEDLTPRPEGNTTWDRLQEGARKRRDGVQNAGIRRALPARDGAWLTFDLCPSNRPLDRKVFTDLEPDAQPLPVFLEVSGRWVETHPRDFAWLTAERDAGRLSITWVNHTEHHAYHPGVALDRNFLLLPGTDLETEIFGVEQGLLDRGEVPSVFFRFPGLVSSPELVDRVLGLGLIPLGSSAWLAKQQFVKSGAIVLTHPNGNEPLGLGLLETWDHGHRSDLADGNWHWLGLEDWTLAVIPPL